MEPLAGGRRLAGKAGVRGAFRQFEQKSAGLLRHDPFQHLGRPQGPQFARRGYGFRDHEFFKLKILGLHETKHALVG